MSSVFNKNCCQKKIKNPKYVGYRIYKRVFNYSVWVQVWCTEKKKARKYDKLLELIHGRI